MSRSDAWRAMLYGVGLGPGDPELVTLKAVRVLERVQRIYYPYAAGRERAIALGILQRLGLPAARLHGAALPMGASRAALDWAYDALAAEIGAAVGHGESAAFATVGDPLFYSTFIPLHERICARFSDLPIEIIPGVSSVHAAAARAGVALCRHDDAMAIVPAAYGLPDLLALTEQFRTVVLTKVQPVFAELRRALAGLPADRNSVFLERIGAVDERVTIGSEGVGPEPPDYFSLVLLQRSEKRAERPPDAAP